MTARAVERALSEAANPAKAAHSVKFFQAEEGGYGHGDKFLGVTVPEQRRVAKDHRDLSFTEIVKLLRSAYHEHRLTGFFILIHRYQRRVPEDRAQAFAVCMEHLSRLNNWDLVDSVAPKLIGPHMRAHPDHKTKLREWAQSSDVWERRIAMVTTAAFIREGEFDDALAIARLLVRDQHDLIHKAVGWMLREIGERDLAREREFLDEHASEMPRTMLRYAVEKFTPDLRKHYMAR